MEAAPSSATNGAPTSIKPSAKRVLIVEDDAHIAELLRMHLHDEGYAVTHAADGHAGMRALQRGQWDALVLDPEVVDHTLGVLLKYQDDIAKVQGSEAARLLSQVRSDSRLG